MRGVHAGVAQTFAVPPPPQVCVPEQTPHISKVPQPSPTWPQFFPSVVQAPGVQTPGPQTLVAPPAPHDSPITSHLPQES